MVNPIPPQNPAGEFLPPAEFSAANCRDCIDVLTQAPARLRAAVDGLTNSQLDRLYRNWTIRQIVFHLGDSHQHAFLRCKWALTEDHPTIKPYEEGRWAELIDARTAAIDGPLLLLDGLHATWTQLLNLMTEDQFHRTFYHPESKQTVPLWKALNYYAWHSRHHTAQIVWVREFRT